MRKIFTLFLLLVTMTGLTQDSQTVSLRWKIGDNEKLSYLTFMTDIDTGSIEMNFDGL